MRMMRCRTSTRELQPDQVVAICDHLGLLTFCQDESKIGGKAVRIALDHAIQLGQDRGRPVRRFAIDTPQKVCWRQILCAHVAA